MQTTSALRSSSSSWASLCSIAEKSTMHVGTFSGVKSPGMVISSALGGTSSGNSSLTNDKIKDVLPTFLWSQTVNFQDLEGMSNQYLPISDEENSNLLTTTNAHDDMNTISSFSKKSIERYLRKKGCSADVETRKRLCFQAFFLLAAPTAVSVCKYGKLSRPSRHDTSSKAPKSPEYLTKTPFFFSGI